MFEVRFVVILFKRFFLEQITKVNLLPGDWENRQRESGDGGEDECWVKDGQHRQHLKHHCVEKTLFWGKMNEVLAFCSKMYSHGEIKTFTVINIGSTRVDNRHFIVISRMGIRKINLSFSQLYLCVPDISCFYWNTASINESSPSRKPRKKLGQTRVLVPGHQNTGAPHVTDWL